MFISSNLELLDHLEASHKIETKKIHEKFPNKAECENWLGNLENQAFQIRSSNSTKTFYECSFSQRSTRKYNKKGLRAPVSYLTKKSSSKCPVHIVRTKESDGSYLISGSLAPDYSHNARLASTFLPRVAKKSILSELQKGVFIEYLARSILIHIKQR